MSKKFKDNIKRDETVKIELLARNIKCLVIWECTIKRMMKAEDLADRIIDEIVLFLNDNRLIFEI